MFRFRKATENERNEISRLQYGGRWIYSDEDMSDENFALFFGKMKTLFGEPDEISESWESMYDYTIVAEDEKGNNFLFSVYHGAGGSSIATPTDYNNIDLAPYKQAEKELLELIENTEPADYEWESVYEDIPANVKYIVKDGKATIESEISEFDM